MFQVTPQDTAILLLFGGGWFMLLLACAYAKSREPKRARVKARLRDR